MAQRKPKCMFPECTRKAKAAWRVGASSSTPDLGSKKSVRVFRITRLLAACSSRSGPCSRTTMALLADKKVLITGVLSNRSIAYGVAKACAREGATLAFTYVNDDLKDRVAKIIAEFGSCPLFRCDVASDEDIAMLFDDVGSEWGALGGILH